MISIGNQFSIDIQGHPLLCFLHEKAMPYQTISLRQNRRKSEVMSSGKHRTFLGGESVDHKQEKELHKRTERKRDNKEKKKIEKTREQEESKGTRVIRPLWFVAVGFILAMAALLSWFFLR